MVKKPALRTPITYYGGKQKLVSTIVPLIPQHTLYCEPFIGGAAVFFSKEASKVEVINDTNKEVINFYQVCRNRFHELQSLVRTTLHSREQHDDAFVIYSKPHLHDEVRRAWALWVLSTQSFSAMLDGSWGFDKKKHTTSLKIHNRREEFTEQLAIRLQTAQIECADALYIINSRDGLDSFFYCDPPYYNSDLGHYDGYSEKDFEELLKLLSKIKGKFLLSSYPSELLAKYSSRYKWHTIKIDQRITAAGADKKLFKVEVLTANYKI
jgi:DNA adenine methylase